MRYVVIVFCAIILLCGTFINLAWAHLGTEIVVDKLGRVYFVDTIRNQIWRIDAKKNLLSLATDKHTANLIIDGEGEIYVIHNGVWKITTDGNLVKIDSSVKNMKAVGPDGAEYKIDSNQILKIEPDGKNKILAGDLKAGSVDGQGENARFNRPVSLAVDREGTVLVADYGSRRLRKITPAGEVTTIIRSGWPWMPAGIATAQGEIYLLERQGDYRSWTLPVLSTVADLLGNPRVRKISADGQVTTIVMVANGRTRAIVIIVFTLLVLLLIAGLRVRKILVKQK